MKEYQPVSPLNLKTVATLLLVMGTPVAAGMICNHIRNVDRIIIPGADPRSAEEKYEDKLFEEYRKQQQTPTPTPTPEVQSSVMKKTPFEHGNFKTQNALIKTALRFSFRG